MKWYETTFFRNLIALVLILLAVYLGYILIPFIDSFSSIVAVVLYPIILALILYYLFRPLVRFLKGKITVYGGIAVVYLILALIVTVIGIFVYPKIVQEINLLESINIEKYLNINELATSSDGNINIRHYIESGITKVITEGLYNLHSYIMKHIIYFISTVTNFLIILFVTPFMLFYFLKDEDIIYNNFISSVPGRFKDNLVGLLHEFDSVLLHFITGRVIISFIINMILLISFLIIGLKLVTIIITISFFFYIIPSVGSFIAMIPALLIGFSQGSVVGFEVLAIMGVAGCIEGFLVTPQVMGKALYIHPLTVLIILLISGYLLGFVGLLFSTPIYVLLKILFKHVLDWKYERAH